MGKRSNLSLSHISSLHSTLSELSRPQSHDSSIASFLAFALHTLTGWLPTAPWSLREVSQMNASRLQILFDEITLGGASGIERENIPSQDAIVMPHEDDTQVAIFLYFLNLFRIDNEQRNNFEICYFAKKWKKKI